MAPATRGSCFVPPSAGRRAWSLGGMATAFKPGPIAVIRTTTQPPRLGRFRQSSSVNQPDRGVRSPTPTSRERQGRQRLVDGSVAMLAPTVSNPARALGFAQLKSSGQ
jgi:hypothetical protein